MEMNIWIPKDETSQMASGFDMSCKKSCCGYGNDGSSDQLQYSNLKALLKQQNNFCVPDEYYENLDNLTFDDFVVNPSPGNDQCLFSDPNLVKNQNIQWDQSAEYVVPQPMGELSVSVEHIGQPQITWTNAYSCQSPDSGFDLSPSLSPNSDIGSSYSFSSRVADLESPASVASTYGSPGSFDSGMQDGNGQGEVGLEIYHDLIMRHLVQDIKSTCVRLSISQDPKQWTSPDCQAWLTDMAAQYHLTQVPYEKLRVNGATLCNMSLAQFNQCFPSGGETVHAQLQIWNSANDYCKKQANNGSNRSVIISNVDSLNNVMLDVSAVEMQITEDDISGYLSPQLGNDFQMQQHPFEPMIGDGATYTLGALLPSPGSFLGGGASEKPESYTANVDGAAIISNSNNIHLWQFLRELLDQEDKFSYCVRWIDRDAGIFKIEDSHKLARLWGQRKNRPAMNYDKLSRSLRQYYKKNILKKTTRSQRLIYQFMHPYHNC